METARLELDDIQGIIRRGYGKMDAACFVLLNIANASRARGWLGDLADNGEIRDGMATPDESDTCVNIAFTQPGFEELGLKKHFIKDKQFSVEFEDGMTTEHRQDILGDVGDSDPKKWDWGGTRSGQESVHILLMLYARDEKALAVLYGDHQKKFKGAGLSLIRRLDTLHLPGQKEHFGFRDGIAQPKIAGLLDTVNKEEEGKRGDFGKDLQAVLETGGSKENIVAAGEFILGYKNGYSKIPNSPKVKASSDPGGNLKDDGPHAKDFGLNGSYLVFRQLKQNVPEFWKYIDKETQNPDKSSNPEARDGLAAKMVGRWRSGAPLVLAPKKDNPDLKNADTFGYFKKDPHGDKCPMASHVRRTNPRDSPLERTRLNAEGSEISLKDANKHRIIRRGRAYGQPISDSMDPQKILDAKKTAKTKKDRGLNFICFNANIGRQFEFIQHTWINNPKFSELYCEADPLMGPIPKGKNATSTQKKIFGKFVAPGEPLRQRVSGLKRFVDVVGGAYFFMPGIKAIKYLAKLPES